MSVLVYPTPRRSSYCPRIEFVVDTTPDYATQEQVGAAVEITNAARTVGGGGIIDSFTVLNHDALNGSVMFHIFRASPATSANDNNATFVISDDDAELLIATFLMPTGRMANLLGTGKTAGTIPLNFRYTCDVTSLWVVCVANDTLNFSRTDGLQIIPGLSRD